MGFLENLSANFHKNRDAILELLEVTAITGPSRNTDISHQVDGEIWGVIKDRIRVFGFMIEVR